MSLHSDASTESLDGQIEILSADPACAPPRIRELEEELASKDELVTALTVQLEQLAEQLDRLQRSGADRKKSAGGGGLPTDVVESHRKLVGDLERVVQQWEDMQAGVALGRIEVQLSELRDFVSDRLSGHTGFISHAAPALPTSVVMERISVTSSPSEPLSLAEPDPTNVSHSPPSELPSMWESLKSRMLDEPAPTINVEDMTAEEAAVAELPPPEAVSFSSASAEDLEHALDERDAYIAFLLRKLRQTQAVPSPPDWVSLERVPEDLCQTLEAHTKKLEESLRLAEIELSIERARIGREQMQLRHQQDAIEKQMRRLGLKTVDEQIPAAEEASTTDRRWVRFLGVTKGK